MRYVFVSYGDHVCEPETNRKYENGSVGFSFFSPEVSVGFRRFFGFGFLGQPKNRLTKVGFRSGNTDFQFSVHIPGCILSPKPLVYSSRWLVHITFVVSSRISQAKKAPRVGNMVRNLGNYGAMFGVA